MSSAILGEGQLAQMLLEASGNTPWGIWSQDPLSPAAQLGRGPRYSDLAQCVRENEVLLIENEFVDVPALRALAQSAPRAPRFVPSLESIETLQDKLHQKSALERLGIPHAPFLPQGDLPFEAFMERARAKLGPRPILKWSRLGYDGKGVWFTEPGQDSRAREFAEAARAQKVPLFAEARIEFTRELAMTAARGAQGECVSYPVVQTTQSSGICKQVLGPATQLGLAPEQQAQIGDWMCRLANDLDLVGVFAFELFETPSGIWVNEIAPRVHNSSHYTQDAARPSQFALHLQAAAGQLLAPPVCSPFFGMLNLLGPAGVHRDWEASRTPASLQIWNETLRSRGFTLHWYGKAAIRPGRKLGHINFVASDRMEFDSKRQMLPEIENEFRACVSSR